MFVLDTNVAIAVAMGTDTGKLFKDLIESNEQMISSELTLAESTHSIRKYVKGGYASAETGKVWMQAIQGMVDKFYPIQPDIEDVLHEALRLDHSPYDLFNFVLARRHNATIVSCDKKFISLCFKEGLNVCTEVDLSA